VGGACVFRGALVREPLKEWTPFERASGPRRGISPKNVHWLVYRVCENGRGIDGMLYHKLCTEIPLDQFMDLVELNDVHDSWKHAEMHNAEHQRKVGGY